MLSVRALVLDVWKESETLVNSVTFCGVGRSYIWYSNLILFSSLKTSKISIRVRFDVTLKFRRENCLKVSLGQRHWP